MITNWDGCKFLHRTIAELPHLTKSGRDLLKAVVFKMFIRGFPGKKESEEINHQFPICCYTCEKCGRLSFVPFEIIFCRCEEDKEDAIIQSITYRSEKLKQEHLDWWNRWLIKNEHLY